MSPARINRRLRDEIGAARLDVEVVLDHAWIFLRRPGFVFSVFGDEPVRAKSLGKWMATFERDAVVDEAVRILPLISDDTVRLAKLTNVANVLTQTGRLVVYCLDRDETCREALEALGWDVTWKLNRETFAGR